MADTEEEDNRRLELRVPIELKVEYKKLNSFFSDYTKNICKGGTFIRTKKPLDVGTVFLFKLMVPRMKEALAIRGAVWWALYCVLTDKLDGAVARRLGATSQFGVQMDSLADFLSFGVVPALLFYVFLTTHPACGWSTGAWLWGLRAIVILYVFA